MSQHPLTGRIVLLVLAAVLGCGGGSDPVEPPPQPASLVANAGGAPQTATVGTVVAATPAVRVMSAAGQPMAGGAVVFAVTAGGGTLGATSATTNADGVASAGSWTLGTTAGTNAVRATVGSLAPVTFEATAEAGPVASLTVVRGDAQIGEMEDVLPLPVVVKATDAHGNPTSDVTVVFAVAEGGGSAQPAQATTNAAGEAQTMWTLGVAAERQVLRPTLPDGTAPDIPTATATAPPRPFTALQVATDEYVTCAIRETGEAYCWGDNYHGQVGNGTQLNSYFSPQKVTVSSSRFVQIDVAPNRVCALTREGVVECWGWRAQPQLTAGAGHRFVSVAVGAETRCALRDDGIAICAGRAAEILGEPPIIVNPSGVRFATITAGDEHACALTAEGRAYCWGDDQYQQLGNGGALYPGPTATAVVGDLTFRSVSAGAFTTCGVTLDGRAYCWGGSGFGEIGDGITTRNHSAPTVAAGGATFDSLATTNTTTCGIHAGRGFCWGFGHFGQRGDGTTASVVSTPKPVTATAETLWLSISPGMRSCAISTRSRVYCWGIQGTYSFGGERSTTPQLVRMP